MIVRWMLYKNLRIYEIAADIFSKGGAARPSAQVGKFNVV